MPQTQRKEPRQYRQYHGKRLQCWTCSDCGRDLGPVASQYRMRETFAYPLAYAGKNGETVCKSCYDAQQSAWGGGQ